jgi:hypothetical protein
VYHFVRRSWHFVIGGEGIDGDGEGRGVWRVCWFVVSQARALIDSSIPQSAKSPGRTRCGGLFGGGGELWEWLFVRVRACSSSMRYFHCSALDAVKRSLEAI